MWIKSTALCCCLLACSLVSAKTVVKNALTPTEAPLIRSTVKPTMAPILIWNVPPKASGGNKAAMQSKDPMPALQAKPLDLPPTVVKAENLKTGLRVSDTVQVTGFITNGGKIYEIQDKDGIGMIEGRQSPANESINVCNYGSVVIYSDRPCKKITNIQVSDIVQTTLKDEKETGMANNPNTQDTNQYNDGHKDDDDTGNNTSLVEELDYLQKKTAPQNQNKQRRRNKNRKSSSVNSNQVNRRRTQAQRNRNRKNPQQNRHRRLQNQHQQQLTAHRLQHNNENRIRPNHRRHNRKGNGSNEYGSNGNRRPNTNRNGSGKRIRSNQGRQNQSKRRQHNAASDRRRFDEYDY